MASAKVLEQKKLKVSELKTKLEGAIAGVLVDYRGINVEQDTKMRKELREAGVEYIVVKNSLLRFAAKEAGYDALTETMVGTTAIALSTSDPVAAAKILDKYAGVVKGDFALKSGFVEGKILDTEGVKSLAKLPSREQLLTQFLFCLNSGIRGLAVVLGKIKEQKESEGEAA